MVNNCSEEGLIQPYRLIHFLDFFCSSGSTKSAQKQDQKFISDSGLMSIDNSSFASLIESLLAVVSAISESAACIDVEHRKFIEVGCYIYRVVPVIMELQYTENTPKNAKEILQSLHRNVNLAKELVGKCYKDNCPVSDNEMRSIIVHLEELIKDIGECLCLIPSASFGEEEYAKVAVRSLSEEMQNVRFEVKQSQTQVLETKQLELQISSSSNQPRKELTPAESDLYAVDVDVDIDVDVSVSVESSQILSLPRLADFLYLKNQRSQCKHENINKSSLTTLPQVAHYMEPLYDTFFCPLSKQIMNDPVTVQSGVTYERKAIMEWFETFNHVDEIICPTTGQKLKSTTLSTNVALKTTIEEWKDRNEATRIKVSRSALSLASSDSMILEAIKDLQHICQRKRYNKVQVLSAGISPLLVKLLVYKGRDVRCAALELLKQLAEEDEGKEIIAKAVDVSVLIESLSSSHQPVQHASLLFLLELSRSQALGKKIGSATGAILMLIRIKYNHHVDSIASQIADGILKNLECYPDNIKHMAENGLVEPLLNHLTEGSEEVQLEMASYLGEMILEHDIKTYVAERASPSLIKMVQTGNTIIRKAAFKALEKISSYHPNGRILVEAGIVHIMAEEMFTRTIYDEPMNSKKEAAAILANVLESGVEHDSIRVNSHGHRISSDYVVYNLIYMLKNSTPEELNMNLIRIILCLTKSPNSMAKIISIVNETEASYTLIELINNPHEQLGVEAIKLLITLAPHVGNTLAERLCKTRGQPENLIEAPTETNNITERQAVSAKFLAKLPQRNLTLNLALLNRNVIPRILHIISQIQRTGTRGSRHATIYLESLVGILVRFTTTLYEPQILVLARTHNLTSVFTELLMKTSSDEVQRLSAIGLENLSLESINLSRPPQIKKSKFMKMCRLPKFLSSSSSKKGKISACPVHRGACSSQNTFCLIDAKAVERLLACLDHENGEVVEASLSAICTLLDDNVDVDNSVTLLRERNAIQHILNVVKEHRHEGLWQKSFWMIEKFLVKGGNMSVSDISQDRLLPASLVSAFHHGSGKTREMAENILRHLNRMPSPSSTTFYTM